MNINLSIFKAYDIRGVYGVDFNDDFAYELGLAYCQLRREEMGRDDFTIVVGRDMRLSSPALHKELIRGLVAGGAHVIDIGLASTPTFYFTVAHYRYDGGIQVSASHNPKEYNGFKMVRQMASPISEDTGIPDLKKIIMEGGAKPAMRSGSLINRQDILADQVALDMSFVDASLVKPMKVVIDTSNAMGAPYFDELFKHLPQLTIERMNWELDGSFPSHEADPFKPENIAELCARVKESEADMGIATDGDSDRIFFVDENGKAVTSVVTRAILAKIFLEDKPGATIAYDIRPGKKTYDVIMAHGGQPLVTRVGHSLIKRAMIDAGAYFSGETSGHFSLNMGAEGCYEVPGVIAMKMLIEISKSGQSFSEYAKQYDSYFLSPEISLRVENASAIIERLCKLYADGKQNMLDGLTVDYPDYWFNVRMSNTEPILRVSLEAATKEIMEKETERLVHNINNQ